MASVVLKWNPSKWPWPDLQQRLAEIGRDGATTIKWSCGNAQKVEVGDRVFLLRVGREPRGLVGIGTVTRAPFEDEHWDPARSADGTHARYVEVRFERLDDEALMSTEELTAAPFDSVEWLNQSPVIYVPDDVAAAVAERLNS